MTRRYRRSKRREEDEDLEIEKVIAICVVLFAGYLVLQYKINRANFWHLTFWAAVVLVGIFVAIIAYFKISVWSYRQRRGLLVQRVKEVGLEQEILNFVMRFGLEAGKKNDPWKFRNYAFDTDRLDDFTTHLGEKGLKVDIEQLKVLLTYYIQQKEFNLTATSVGLTPQTLDALSGQDFENLLQRLYTARGYQVQQIGGVGDQGGDLIANGTGQRILIQAKRYKGSVGNAAVQQAVAAKGHYDCGLAVVASTGYFTREAVDLAKTNHVMLIGRSELQQLLIQHLKESWL